MRKEHQGASETFKVSGRLLGSTSGHEDSALAAAFSPDGTQLLSAGGDGILQLWTLPIVGWGLIERHDEAEDTTARSVLGMVAPPMESYELHVANRVRGFLDTYVREGEDRRWVQGHLLTQGLARTYAWIEEQVRQKVENEAPESQLAVAH